MQDRSPWAFGTRARSAGLNETDSHQQPSAELRPPRARTQTFGPPHKGQVPLESCSVLSVVFNRSA